MTSINRFHTVRTVGSGSSGCARLVRDLKTGEMRVIKDIAVRNADERRAAWREAEILRTLPPHPNIISFCEAFEGEEGANVCIVTEYAAGGDLDALIKSRKGKLFDEERVWKWFAQIVSAVDHVHKNGFLHRDLKTKVLLARGRTPFHLRANVISIRSMRKNIFLSSYHTTVKLGDFGIARPLDTDAMATTAIGTPFYLSPEMCRGRGYGWKSDMWALGCVLVSTSLKILKGTYTPIASHYSQDLSKTIGKLLDTVPNRRMALADLLKLPRIRTQLEGVVPARNPRAVICEEAFHPGTVQKLERRAVRIPNDMEAAIGNRLRGSIDAVSPKVGKAESGQPPPASVRSRQKQLVWDTVSAPARKTQDVAIVCKQKLRPPEVPQNASIFWRIEVAKVELERMIGLPAFLEMYTAVRSGGPRRAEWSPVVHGLICQLVRCEDRVYQ
ncbi:Serine/threonine-protein kinase Nek1 [Borealophlyctis nickersoniae]|nr:Serine/threonine-protein kinase Nek1 [Borealophlyctis nickersoniae]